MLPLNRMPCHYHQLAVIDPADYRVPVKNNYSYFERHWHSVLENAAVLFLDRRPAPVRRDVISRRALLRLAQLIHRLGQTEPALIRTILSFLAPCHAAVPILVPLTALFGAPFARLRTSVADLPRGWRTGPIRKRVGTLAAALPLDALAAVRRVVLPNPRMVTVNLVLRYNRPANGGPRPETINSILHHIPDDTYPLPLRLTHGLHMRGTRLTRQETMQYWSLPESRQRGNVIKGFEQMFPRDVGRLIYGAAIAANQPDPTSDATWKTVQQHMRAYNKILKQHS
jgi:hypothetical protein